jgi:hypothetical protein
MLIVFICILVICALLPRVARAADGSSESFQLFGRSPEGEDKNLCFRIEELDLELPGLESLLHR